MLACAAPCVAASPDRDWPSVVVTPILDEPLRDAAISKGQDGLFYLTATSPTIRPDGSHDYDFNQGIRLWRSEDLKSWTDLGWVWDFQRDAQKGDTSWQQYRRLVPGKTDQVFARAATAPELHFAKGTYWICFSLNNKGTGLLRSTSGKPEGPYESHSYITVRGGDPSMFVDDDGCVYWLFDGGWIARMSDDLTALAEPPRLLQPALDPAPGHRENSPDGYGGHPLQVGSAGAFLFKRDGRYYLTAWEENTRCGVRFRDTWIAYADSLYGPYSRRHLMVPCGGAVTVFEGPHSTAVEAFRGRYDSTLKEHIDGPQYYVAYSGHGAWAQARDRAALVPLEWLGPTRWEVYVTSHVESFPRKPQHVFTEKGPWSRMKPLAVSSVNTRDMSVTHAPDGWFYLSGSVIDWPGELVMWRSRDLCSWEEMPALFRYEDIHWLPHKLGEPPSDLDAKACGQWDFCRVFWGAKLEYLRGNYYIIHGTMRHDRFAPGNGGAGVLCSISGKPEGPYECLWKVGGQLGRDPGPLWPDFFTGPDGKLYASTAIDWKLHVAEVGDLDLPGWKWDYRPVDTGGIQYASDAFGGMTVFEGLFVLDAIHWSGPAASVHGRWSEKAKHHSTYDGYYIQADGPWGPIPVDRELFVVPHIWAVYGNLFKDDQGQWWAVSFGNEHTSPWWQQPGLFPVNVRNDDGRLHIEVPKDGWTERQLKIMGGGEVAEVKTVQETLP